MDAQASRGRAPPGLAAAVIALLLLAACDRGSDQGAAPPRPVQVVAVEAMRLANDVRLSGEIQAEKSVALAFRIGGRIADRSVNVGDRVASGQVVARLEPETERNAVRAAKASLDAARGDLTTARNAFDRQEQLMAQGFTTRPRFDQALQAQETAQARLESAEAQLELAQDRLGFTELRSDVDGVVTARNAEPGEVVQPGRLAPCRWPATMAATPSSTFPPSSSKPRRAAPPFASPSPRSRGRGLRHGARSFAESGPRHPHLRGPGRPEGSAGRDAAAAAP